LRGTLRTSRVTHLPARRARPWLAVSSIGTWIERCDSRIDPHRRRAFSGSTSNGRATYAALSHATHVGFGLVRRCQLCRPLLSRRPRNPPRAHPNCCRTYRKRSRIRKVMPSRWRAWNCGVDLPLIRSPFKNSGHAHADKAHCERFRSVFPKCRDSIGVPYDSDTGS